MNQPDIPAYLRFIPELLRKELWLASEEIAAVPGLRVASGPRAMYPEVETDEALAFVCGLYCYVRPRVNQVLNQRVLDREFMDRGTLECVSANAGLAYTSPDYQTVQGKADASGRVVVKPLSETMGSIGPVGIPDSLKRDQVTRFGPSDSAKLSINAMNAGNRVREVWAGMTSLLRRRGFSSMIRGAGYR